MSQQSFLEKCYKDNSGKVTIYQNPNAPLIVWMCCVIFSRVAPTGKPHELLGLVGFGAIFTWAWLEVFRGANYFRRALGLIVIVLALINRVN